MPLELPQMRTEYLFSRGSDRIENPCTFITAANRSTRPTQTVPTESQTLGRVVKPAYFDNFVRHRFPHMIAEVLRRERMKLPCFRRGNDLAQKLRYIDIRSLH